MVGDDESGFYGAQYWHERVPKEHGFPTLEERARSDLTERAVDWLRRLVARFAPPAKVLELGCAHGGFVYLLDQAGFDAEGLEMSPTVVRQAEELFGVTVHRGPLEQAELAGRYDLIAAFDVLEHLADPLTTLRTAIAHLEPGGALILQTPCYRDEGADWPMLLADEHLFLYTAASAEQLLRTVGLSHVEIRDGFFPHDMWIVASTQELPALRSDPFTSLPPLVRALVDGDEERRRLADRSADEARQRAAVEADRDAKEAVVERLRGEVSAIDEDRRAKDAVIDRLRSEMAALDEDRQAKEAVIDRLRGEIEALDEDRQAKDAVIERLRGEVAAIDEDRRAKDAVIERLRGEVEAVDEDRRAKDAVIDRLSGEVEAIDGDRRAKDQVIERVSTELAAVSADRQAKDAWLEETMAEWRVLVQQRDDLEETMRKLVAALHAKDQELGRLHTEHQELAERHDELTERWQDIESWWAYRLRRRLGSDRS